MIAPLQNKIGALLTDPTLRRILTEPGKSIDLREAMDTGKILLVNLDKGRIGEGASGGALGIGIGDRVLMLENTWYSVISPESCSSILWHNWTNKETAAEQLKLTPEWMFKFKLVDGVIPEPLGGAHNNPEQMAVMLKAEILRNLNELEKIPTDEQVKQRVDKFSRMGVYEE